ncbi:MAG: hypothetical protein QGF59_31175 [Pirellulaceae bacterium]|nr:hypothetical protein [Pirellulaceae bacterium]
MTREDIIRQIVRRDVEQLGLTEVIVQQQDAKLYQSACDHFGTWETALQYAGVDIRHAAPLSSRDCVLREIRKLCVRGCNLTTASAMKRDRRLYDAARHHFGTWQNALREAGINLEHVRLPKKPRTLDKDKIIRQLHKRHEAGLSMKRNDVCLDNRALATAAINAFHSWRRALAAAGLAPEELLAARGNRWSKERIIELIHARQREGKPINYSAIRREDSALISAARRYFGNWSKALLAAGVDADR